ncbi:SulP family inorganic anion transporter [Marinomonas sp.]
MFHLLQNLLPFLNWSKEVDSVTIRADISAGITGAILVLPQGVAYALIAGLPAEYGLYTAIVSATLAALFGSSMHMISGPTAALSIVAATVVSSASGDGGTDYISLMLTLTFMVGVIQCVLGFLNFGVLVNFISHSVVQGFTAGAAIIIAASQLKNLLGLDIQSDGSLISYVSGAYTARDQTNFAALSLGFITLISAIFLKKYMVKVPYLLGAMSIGVGLCIVLNGEYYGIQLLDPLSGTLPPFSLPLLDSSTFSILLSGAFAVALLGLIEAASIARSIAMRSKQQIDGNQEFIGQGVSNLFGGFFSCYPSSGSFTRSGGNYDAGAKTPLASVVSAVIVILFVLFFPDLTQYIPVPVMAGSILLITWNLFDVKGFIVALKAEKSEVITFLGTFVCTLFVQLEYAIYIGVVISIGFYLRRTSRPKITIVAPVVRENGKRQIRNISRYNLHECPAIKMVRVDGSIFFGSSQHLQKAIESLSIHDQKALIIIAKGINFIDSTGQHMLMNEVNRLEAQGGKVFFSSLKGNVCDELKGTEFREMLVQGRLYDSTSTAITKMIEQLNGELCKSCQVRVFSDCPNQGLRE